MKLPGTMPVRLAASSASRVFLLLGLAAAASSCGRSPDPRTAPSHDRITIAATPLAGSAPIFVADEKGFFRAEGLDVKIRLLPSGQQTLVELFGGRADFATAGDTPIARSVVEGKPLKLIGTIGQNNFANVIVARRDRGISRGEDLKGKRVGKASWTTADFFLHVYLTTSYIDPADVQELNLAPTELNAQLLDGQLDAISTWPPYSMLAAKALGTNAVTLHDPDVYTMTWALLIRPEWPNVAPDSIPKVLRALLRSANYIRGQPEECRAIYARRASLDAATAADVWRGWNFSLSLDQGLILDLEDQARWMIRQGAAARAMPNFLDCIYADGLKAVARDAVHIPGS